MFRGRSLLKLDPKGRLSFPTQLKRPLTGEQKLIITNSLYNNQVCLDLYTWNEWLKLEKKIARMPQMDSQVQAYQRFYLASGEPCDLDSQGRMLVPQIFREYAELDSDIVMIGMGHKIELWDAKKWQKIFSELKNNFEKIQNSLADIEKDKK
jgi:MraZ protein